MASDTSRETTITLIALRKALAIMPLEIDSLAPGARGRFFEGLDAQAELFETAATPRPAAQALIGLEMAAALRELGAEVRADLNMD